MNKLQFVQLALKVLPKIGGSLTHNFLTQIQSDGTFQSTMYAVFDKDIEYQDMKKILGEDYTDEISICYKGFFSTFADCPTEFEMDSQYKVEFVRLPCLQNKTVPNPLPLKTKEYDKIYFMENSKGVSFIWDNNKMCCVYKKGILKPSWSMNSWGDFMCWAKQQKLY